MTRDKVHPTLAGAYSALELVFDAIEVEYSGRPNGGCLDAAFFDRLGKDIEATLNTALWLSSHVEEMVRFKIKQVLDEERDVALEAIRQNIALNNRYISEIRARVLRVIENESQ